MRIDIGNLDRRVSFFKKGIKLNELGEETHELTKYATVWAEVKGMRGYEKMNAVGNVLATEIIKVIVRYRTDVSVAKELEYKKERYDIKSVVELGRNEYLEIVCEKKDKEGAK